jgi:hypothetical protein
MDSFLTVYLKSKATNISKYLNENISYIKTHHIISAGLIVHACALMNLLNNNYPLFILLFFKGYFITLVSRIYLKKYENNDSRLKYFYNVSTWIIILSTYTIFSNLYNKKIGIPLVCLVIILFLLCNLNFMLDKYNETNKCIEFWDKCIKKVINKDNVDNLVDFTKYFDDSMLIIYLMIIMTFLYYK